MIPYSRQTISKNDIDAVVKVLKSDYLTQGPQTLKFEKKLRKLRKNMCFWKKHFILEKHVFL